MADRISRVLGNSKETSSQFVGTKSVIGYPPSPNSMKDGDIVFAQSSNKQLALFKKYRGRVHKSYLSSDGNQYIDKDINIAGNINLSNKLITKNYPAFRVTATAGQALATGAWRTITFASSVHDNGSDFDLSNEYFVAPVKGIYSFTAQVLYEDTFSEHMDDGERLDVRIYNITDSATVAVGLYMMKHDFPDDRFLSVHCTTQTQLSVGDQIRVDSNNTTGSTINTYESTQTTHSYFTGHLICAL